MFSLCWFSLCSLTSLPSSTNVHARQTGDSKLSISLNVDGYLFLCVAQMINWQLRASITTPLQEMEFTVMLTVLCHSGHRCHYDSRE